MKKQVFFLVLLIGLCSFKASAGPSPKLTFKEGKVGVLQLNASAINNAIQVVILDVSGGLLFTETLVKGYTYIKYYDLTDFLEGVYFFKIVEATNVKYFKLENSGQKKISELDKLPFD
jgi:hypothetical protein